MDDELLKRIRRFRTDYFPQYQGQFKALVEQGQHPTILFVGCSDSRLLPYMLTGAGPGELFIVRTVGALVPPYNGLHGLHGTAEPASIGKTQSHGCVRLTNWDVERVAAAVGPAVVVVMQE